MKILPKLSNLTPDDRVWRLDWFGDCGYPAHIRRFAQPSIKVVLSPIRNTPVDHATLLLPDGTDHQHPYEAWAPISALPLLTIGDLWQDGRQIASPDYQVETFKALTITPETSSFIKAGLAIDEHFLLPLNQHPWHRPHTHAYCVNVELGGGKRLLVPCVELIRFYFGSSGNFIQRLFTQPLAANSLWTEKHFDSTTKHLHLVLADRISGASATDIGRIANSKFAWRAAAGIFSSCQKATAQRHQIYPYTGFPFEGTTNLVASGVWLPFGEQKHATFLVYRLRSCSHPFPFRSLSYEAGDRKAWHASPSDHKERGTIFSRKQSGPDKVDVTDPTTDKQKRTTTFIGKPRFPDLARKQVWREKIESMGKADVFLRHEDGTLEQIAFGESDAKTDVTGVDVETSGGEDELREGSLPWFVREGISMIKSDPRYAMPSMRVDVVCLLGKNKLIFPLPMVVNEDGEIDQKLLIEISNGKTRPRQGCFVELRGADSEPPKQYFLILEGKFPRKISSIIPTSRNELSMEVLLAIRQN